MKAQAGKPASPSRRLPPTAGMEAITGRGMQSTWGGGGGDAILTVGGPRGKVFGVIVWRKVKDSRAMHVETIRWDRRITFDSEEIRFGIPDLSIKFRPPNQGGWAGVRVESGFHQGFWLLPWLNRRISSAWDCTPKLR